MKFIVSLLLSLIADFPVKFGKEATKFVRSDDRWTPKLNINLTKNYNADDPTFAHINETLVIDVWSHIKTVDILSLLSGSANVKIKLHLSWTDPRLRWNPDDYGGIKKTILSASSLWIVPISFQNSVLDDLSWYSPVVSYDGKIKILFQGEIPVTCLMKSNVPSSQFQICSLIMDFCPFNADLIKFELKPVVLTNVIYPYHISDYTLSTVINSSIINYETEKYCDDVSTSTLEIFFAVKHKNSKLWINILLPSFLLSLCVVFSFLLPANSQEKMAVTTNVLFGHAMYITHFERTISKTDESAVLSVYITTTVVVDVFGIICAACVINVHYFGDLAVNPPSWLLSLCMKIRLPLLIGSSEPQPPSFYQRPQLSKIASTLTSVSSHSCVQSHQNYLLELWAQQDEARHTLLLLQREWQFIALLLDRFFFFIHLVLIIIVTVVFLRPYMSTTRDLIILPGVPLVNPPMRPTYVPPIS